MYCGCQCLTRADAESKSADGILSPVILKFVSCQLNPSLPFGHSSCSCTCLCTCSCPCLVFLTSTHLTPDNYKDLITDPAQKDLQLSHPKENGNLLHLLLDDLLHHHQPQATFAVEGFGHWGYSVDHGWYKILVISTIDVIIHHVMYNDRWPE